MNFARIQSKVDHGLGIASRHLGQPFSAYRVDTTSSGDFPADWLQLASNVPIYWVRRPEGKIPIGIARATVLYDLLANMAPFNLGDVFLCTDAPFSAGISYGAGATSVPGTQEVYAITLMAHQPAAGDQKIGPNTGGRLTNLARVYRPATKPATLSDGSRYWKSTHDNDQALVLANGAFSFKPINSPGSLVPVGLVSAFRASGPLPFGPPPPGMLRPSHWYVTTPPLPGYEPREGDAIVTVDDQRFVVVEPYRQEVNLVGNMLMCDRTTSQAG